MKNLMGIILGLCLVFIFAGNTKAQQWQQQQQKMEVLHQQIQQLRQQKQQELAKADKIQEQIQALQDQMRQTMASMMGGQGMELGSEMVPAASPGAALDGESISSH
jgi:peptidoglycan hydrolase CwlO-like protein